MKTRILILIFISLFISKISAQKKNGKIYLKNGEIKIGLVKLNADGSIIKFRLSKKEKEITKFTYTEVEKFEIENKKGSGNFTTMVYKEIETLFRKYQKLINVIENGKVSLYIDFVNGGNPYTDYYFEKNDKMTKIYTAGNFMTNQSKAEKRINEYFKDCEKLIELRKRKAFEKFVAMKKNGGFYLKLKEIVKFYNEKCD
jgi:hypothetical protein